MLDISIMKSSDLPFAISLTDYERWGNVENDFQRLMALEPEGCFIARQEGERVGMVTTTTYDDYAFMGSLIVAEGYRGQGIGEALIRYGIDYLDSRGITTIELDATFRASPLYRCLGFKDKYLSYRFFRPALSEDARTKRSSPVHAEEIIAFDAGLTGLNRHNVLTRFLNEFNGSVYIRRDDRLRGYTCVFPRADNVYSIGPLVAESRDVAKSLIDDIAVDFKGHPIKLGLPQPSHGLAGYLIKRGFFYRAPSLRMYRGIERHYESYIYGICSPEKG